MASSVGATPLFHKFTRLPCEIRLAIIEEFLHDIGDTKSHPTSTHSLFIPFLSGNSRPRKRRNRLGEYAVINRQWRSMVEKRTFRSLSLVVGDSDDSNVLDDLERICGEDRIEKVSKIHLSIVLDNFGSQHAEPSTEVTNVATSQGITADADVEHDLSIVHAERVATAAFGSFFGILQSWSRKKQPLPVTFEFLCQGPRRLRPLTGTHLRIDSSSFPEVACIDSLLMPDKSDWGIQPASMFQLLAKLPNVTDATMKFEDDLESSDIVQCIQGKPSSILQIYRNKSLTPFEEGSSTNSFQASKLKSLSLESTALWYRRSDPRFYSTPSIQLSQSIFAMTFRLEELYLEHVVDVSAFLRQACVVRGKTSQNNPGWPNMKTICVKGHSSSSPSDDPTVADELCDSVTKALPHLPNLTRLEVAVTSPIYVGERCYWDDALISTQVPPRDDRSAMPDGMLTLVGVKPNQETLDTWQEIARSQWHCKLARAP